MGHTHWSTLPADGATTNRRDERQACAADAGCPGGVRLCLSPWIRIRWIRWIPPWIRWIRTWSEPRILRIPPSPFSGLRTRWIRIRCPQLRIRSPFLRIQQLRTRPEPWLRRTPSPPFSGLRQLRSRIRCPQPRLRLCSRQLWLRPLNLLLPPVLCVYESLPLAILCTMYRMACSKKDELSFHVTL